MPITLKPMEEREFQAFCAYSNQHYAKEKVTAGTWTEEEADEKAKAALHQLLADGLQTQHHRHWTITRNETESIGWLWLYIDPTHPQRAAFIYGFGLYEPYRGQGLAKQALAALDVKAKELGVKKLSLHVFAHNETARRLYELTGYTETDISMSKEL
ncbi:GNAT family N-acetyltransferase [Bacillus atrophaeus]|uniref:GNAT family N-acetyltransferase n=1 Tax=Bacillus atrophaeus TaxID=1452 RepID=UPI003EDAC0D0